MTPAPEVSAGHAGRARFGVLSRPKALTARDLPEQRLDRYDEEWERG